jgi:chloramphenicol-sensitive protein RarD
MRERGLGDKFLSPQLPAAPADAIALAEDLIRRHGVTTVVGSSLGGYYATWLAETFDLKGVLVNPAVVAHLSLQKYIGPQRWLYTGESFDFTLEHVEQLRAIEIPVLAKPERFWLLVERATRPSTTATPCAAMPARGRPCCPAATTASRAGTTTSTRSSNSPDSPIRVNPAQPAATPENTRLGILAGISAYVIWGLVPIFFKQIAEVPAVEIIAHRVVWAMLLMTALLGFGRGFADALRIARSRRNWRIALASALVICNWLTFVWGVNNGHIVETSLGYFILPLLNVALGVLVLKERMRKLQWLAVLCAAIGVAIEATRAGGLPWIALVLAGTFGIYGLLSKQLPLDAASGLFLETVCMLPLALAWLGWLASAGRAISAAAAACPAATCCWSPPVRSPRFRCCCSPSPRGACRCPGWPSCSTSRRRSPS